MHGSQAGIRELCRRIATTATQVAAYYDDNQLPEPTFGPDCPDIPSSVEYERLRISLSQTADDLVHLVNGPKTFIRTFACSHYDLAAFQVALEFKFFENVPVNKPIALSELAQAVGFDEDRVGSVIRLLATQRIFEETDPGVFQHSARSALLAKNEDIRAACHFKMDEMFMAASDTSQCIRNAPFKSDGHNSPFRTRHQMSLFEFYHQYPAKGARFAQAMAGAVKLDRKITELRDEYPWDSLGISTVVDVGGGSGHVSMSLAREFPNLDFIVQDVSKDMLSRSQQLRTDDLQGRVTFMQHNFFDPQPIYSASAYFIRQCIHNWNDSDCVRILRAFVPALEHCKPRTPLLINDTILPDLNTRSKIEEHDLRQLDIGMLVVVGAKQRTKKQFEKILKLADDRFEVVKIHGEGSMGLLEVHLIAK